MYFSLKTYILHNMIHGAGIVVVSKDGSVLMQHRDNKPGIFYPGYWCYPAGHVDKGEDFKTAAIRELYEETGYTPKEVFGLVNEVYLRSDGEKVNRHIYWTIYDEKQEIKCKEGQEMKFIKPEEFGGKKFLPGQEKLLKLAIKRAQELSGSIMIHAVIFDVGGVLHTSIGELVKKDICKTLGISEKQYTSACKIFIPLYNTGEITDEKEFWKMFITYTKSKAKVPGYSLWCREFLRKYQIQKEVMEIVSDIKSNDIKVAILSNTIEPHARVNREKGGYSPFEIVILSSEVGIRKPDVRIYELTLKKLGVKASDAVFIDDSAENVKAAEVLGIHGIVFKDANQLKVELTKIGIKQGI